MVIWILITGSVIETMFQEDNNNNGEKDFTGEIYCPVMVTDLDTLSVFPVGSHTLPHDRSRSNLKVNKYLIRVLPDDDSYHIILGLTRARDPHHKYSKIVIHTTYGGSVGPPAVVDAANFPQPRPSCSERVMQHETKQNEL